MPEHSTSALKISFSLRFTFSMRTTKGKVGYQFVEKLNQMKSSQKSLTYEIQRHVIFQSFMPGNHQLQR